MDQTIYIQYNYSQETEMMLCESRAVIPITSDEVSSGQTGHEQRNNPGAWRCTRCSLLASFQLDSGAQMEPTTTWSPSL